MTTPPLRSVSLLSFLASEKVKVLNHPPYSPDPSLCDFFFQCLMKCFLEISIRLEVLLAALFISVSNRYQKKTIYLLYWVKRLQKFVSVREKKKVLIGTNKLYASLLNSIKKL